MKRLRLENNRVFINLGAKRRNHKGNHLRYLFVNWLKEIFEFYFISLFSNKIQLKLSFPRVKYSMRIQLEIDISIVLADSIRSEVDRQMWSS